ncbi:T9SS type A sorting domain-containing protein [bacterium]|nr:MAG: T9SS type A sorting domain-containing protein [bacterium]
MRKLSIAIITLFALTQIQVQAQKVTGLSGWTLFIDPGHSQTENMGLYNYSEAQKTLRVAMHLRDLLLTETDIDTVYMSRMDDQIIISLAQRTDLANSLGADFYYSIHSDAGGSSSNSTLMLYGGWRQGGQTIEKTPHGGGLMGAYIDTILTQNMQIGRRGNYADRIFYQGLVDNHANTWPYLHVNRQSSMASVLSEAGFHTNPYQQQRNINEGYKKLEGRSAYWAILKYHGIDRPDVGILSGEIKDAESGLLLNGAVASIQNRSYTTDTYQSVFYKHSSDPEQLRNGFFYIDSLVNETSQLIVSHPDYYSDTLDIDIKNKEITFQNIQLVSKKPPFITSTDPGGNNPIVNPTQRIFINFSRAMDKESVEQAISITPYAALRYYWINTSTLSIYTDSLAFNTDYVLTIAETATDNSAYKHGFDGDANGEAGTDYALAFTTGSPDVTSPKVVSLYPHNVTITDKKPSISVLFDELIDHTSVTDETISVISESGDHSVTGIIETYSVGSRSAITFFPQDSLKLSTKYFVHIKGTLTDTTGNALGADRKGYFTTNNERVSSIQSIDNFDASIDSWWLPQQSGSTTGIITEVTSSERSTTLFNKTGSSTASLVVHYGWDTAAPENLIRLYLAPSSAPQSRRFTTASTIQAYVFGDGSGNKFRFMLRDGSNQLEGSSWFTVDWIGWKLISWNLGTDPIVAWVNGDGVLNGSAYVDSFQLTYGGGDISSGYFAFDDFRSIAYATPVSNEENPFSELPTSIQLKQNYPNPFNPSTSIQFELPEMANVKITVYNSVGQQVATVSNQTFSAGSHTVQFNAANLATGMYIYRLEANNVVLTKKMILMK